MKLEDGPNVEPSLALRFLINRCEQRNPFIFSAPFVGLAQSVLSRDEDLSAELKRALPPAALSTEDRFLACEKIFRSALDRIRDDDTDDDTSTDKIPPLKPKIANQILLVARSEGNEMLKSNSFTFLSIWASFTWMGLHTDLERLKDFEERCLMADVEPEKQVEYGLEIITDALSRGESKDQARAIQRPSN